MYTSDMGRNKIIVGLGSGVDLQRWPVDTADENPLQMLQNSSAETKGVDSEIRTKHAS
jgi:hypothetical protein